MGVERLFDIPGHQLERYPQEVAIATKENGTWRSYSTHELIDTAERLALGLMALGVGPGDRVAIASGNRSEWCLVDQAVLRRVLEKAQAAPSGGNTQPWNAVVIACEIWSERRPARRIRAGSSLTWTSCEPSS